MEIVIGVISILVAVTIALIPYFKSKYIFRPELTVDIKSRASSSSVIGFSYYKNDFSKGVIESDTAVKVFQYKWEFEITITNNSDQIAFYPELTFNPNGRRFTQIDIVNKLVPIKPAESLALKAEYNKFEEATSKEKTQISDGPPVELKDLNILLTYQNLKKRSFYTLFDYSLISQKNIFLRRKPEEFKNN